MDKEEIKIKMDVGVDTSLASEGINLLFFLLFFSSFFLTCGTRSLVSGTQNDIVVS